MKYQNSFTTYARPAVKIGGRPHVVRKSRLAVSFNLAFVKALGKVVVAVILVVLLINLVFSNAIGNIDNSIVTMKARYQQLENRQRKLRLDKALLWTNESIERLAAEKLGLYPADTRFRVYNEKTKTFRQL